MPPQIATNVMIGLLIAVGLILLYLFFLFTRNPVLVKIGLRNIPRRPSQSILIIIGLTLSIVIILSALATGDGTQFVLQPQCESGIDGGGIDGLLGQHPQRDAGQ